MKPLKLELKLLITFAVFFLAIAEEEGETNEVKEKDNSTVPDYYNPPFDPADPPEALYSKSGVRLVTINELKAHGSEGPLRPLWLAILGRVFDVDKAYDTHYGPKGGYYFFTGIDGSNAFVTGEFDDAGLTNDILQLTPLQVDEVEGWSRFYDKDYTYVGKLIGRFYDKTGNPTKYWYKYQRKLQEANALKLKKKSEEHQFPPCNSRFVPEEGGTVYCSKKRFAQIQLFTHFNFQVEYLNKGIGLYCTLLYKVNVQSNLSILDTLGTQKLS